MSDRKEPLPVQVIIAIMRASSIHLEMADRESPKLRAINQEAAVRLLKAADDLATHLVAGIEKAMIP